MEIGNLKKLNVGLVRQLENGRIVQIGMTEEQSTMLQIFVAALSKEKPLVELPHAWDLVIKNNC